MAWLALLARDAFGEVGAILPVTFLTLVGSSDG